MTNNTTARLAGLLYFLALPTAGFAYGFLAFMPKDDPNALITALRAGRETLDWTILLGAAGYVDYLLMAALFHKLFARTSKLAADLLVLFVAASVPLALAALAKRMDLLVLLDAAPPLSIPDVMLLVQGETNLILMATIFWGLWMMPLGWLAWKSGNVPKLIGIALIAGGFGYLSGFILPVLGIAVPAFVAGLFAAVTVGSEFAFMFWLIWKGAWNNQDAEPAGAWGQA